MEYNRSTLIVIAALLFAFGCNKPGEETSFKTGSASSPAPVATSTATADQFASARTIFMKQCSACHGEDAKGGTVKVEDVKLKVPSLREGHALKHSDEQLVKQITNGGDGMPKFKDKLKPEEITDLVRFIRQEFQGRQTAANKTDMNMK